MTTPSLDADRLREIEEIRDRLRTESNGDASTEYARRLAREAADAISDLLVSNEVAGRSSASVDDLIARSSLGDDEAVAARNQVDPEIVAAVLRRAEQIREREAAAPEVLDRIHGIVFDVIGAVEETEHILAKHADELPRYYRWLAEVILKIDAECGAYYDDSCLKSSSPA